MWHSAWMYGEIQGLGGISLSDSPPKHPRGYNFMDPLGLDEPSASIAPWLGVSIIRVFIIDSTQFGSRTVNYFTALNDAKVITGLS